MQGILKTLHRPRGVLFFCIFALLWFFALGLVLVGMNVFLPIFIGICAVSVSPWVIAWFLMVKGHGEEGSLPANETAKNASKSLEKWAS